MILYFSGTGNSAYVAKKIALAIKDETVDLNGKIKKNDDTALHSDRPWVIVAPTYGWQLPRIVRDWILQTGLTGNKQAYFVLTCGGGIGNAGKYAAALCEKKDWQYMGCAQVIMPENYIAMFAVPDEERARRIIRCAEPSIQKAIAAIQKGEAITGPKLKWTDKVSSSLANKAFYPLFVHAKKFYSTVDCISCGYCSQVCPLNNIKLTDQKPEWGDQCTHCMACICSCPKQAIEYGNKSKGKPRYQCPVKAEEKL